MTDVWDEIEADAERKPIALLPKLSGFSGRDDSSVDSGDDITQLIEPCQNDKVPAMRTVGRIEWNDVGGELASEIWSDDMTQLIEPCQNDKVTAIRTVGRIEWNDVCGELASGSGEASTSSDGFDMWFYQGAFAETAATIVSDVSGSVAERTVAELIKFEAYLMYWAVCKEAIHLTTELHDYVGFVGPSALGKCHGPASSNTDDVIPSALGKCHGPASSNTEGETRVGAAGAQETKERNRKRRSSLARGGRNKRQNTVSNDALVLDALMELQKRHCLVIKTCTKMAMLRVHNINLDDTPHIKPFVTNGQENEYIWKIVLDLERYGEIAAVFNDKVKTGRPGEQNLTDTINSNAKKYLLYHFGIAAGSEVWNGWKRSEWHFCYEKAVKQALDTQERNARNAASRNTA